MRRSTTQTIIDAMRILVRDIYSEDGVANMAIAEAADRLEELQAAVKKHCVWELAEKYRDIYRGTCRVKWSFGADAPLDSRIGFVKFCPRCGGRIKVKKCKT